MAKAQKSLAENMNRQNDNYAYLRLVLLLSILASLLFNTSFLFREASRVRNEPLKMTKVTSARRHFLAVDATFSNHSTADRSNQTTTIQFLHIKGSETRYVGDLYSGMWWQHRDTFLATPYQRVQFLEDASFVTFQLQETKFPPKYALHGKGVLLTRDWNDLSVEHLSKLVKYLQQLRSTDSKDLVEGALQQLRERLIDFLRGVKPFRGHLPILDTVHEIVSSTLALIPISFSRNTNTTASALDDHPFQILELAVTVASLWRVGIRRVLVVGLKQHQEEDVSALLKLLNDSNPILAADLGNHIFQLQFVDCSTVSSRQTVDNNVPRWALKGLQQAFKDSNASWLGNDPSIWSYIYFTEPDLILNTRSSALPDLTDAIRNDYCIVAHRLEPLPHETDLISSASSDDDATREQFAKFLLLSSEQGLADTTESRSCCDQGSYYPAHIEDPSTRVSMRELDEGSCSTVWSLCCIANTTARRRLRPYAPFIRLAATGTGLHLVHAHQRLCKRSWDCAQQDSWT